MIYDCFVLNEKRMAILYQGSQQILGMLDVRTFASDTAKTSIMVNGEKADASNTYVYKLGTAPVAVTFEQAITAGSDSWVSLSSNPLEVGSLSTNTMVTVAELNSSGKAVAVGTALLNIG